MHGIGHPELLVFGVGTAVAAGMPDPGEIVFAANSFCGRPDVAPVPVYQLTFPDSSGRYSWEDG